jgi:hypothetical protein
MMDNRKTIRLGFSPTLMVVLSLALIVLGATVSQAGIQLPQQINFNAEDLEESLRAHASGLTSSSSTSRRASKEDDEAADPSRLLKTAAPSGSNSTGSTSSTSSGSGASSLLVVLCAFTSTTVLADDATLSELPRDHGFSLPDPPGTDLLRPPRS